MRKAAVLTSLLLLVATIAAARKKKASIDPRIPGAQFVRIISASGNDLDARTLNEDRAAIFRVEQALRSWGRYHIVYNDADADLLFVVRTGRVVGASVGPSISIGQQPPIPGGPEPSGGGTRVGGTGPVVGMGGSMDVSNATEDTISIYDARIGGGSREQMAAGSVLWRKMMSGGLEGKVPLIEELKKDIDAAAAAKATKP